MGANTTEIERAVARSLRDSLEKLQRNADEVNQAIGDLVSACASARPSNTLPHMLRAQTAASSLAATLDVLSRFITSALQPGWGMPFTQQEAASEPEPAAPAIETESPVVEAAFFAAAVLAPPPAFEPSLVVPEPAPAAVEETLRTVASETAASEQAAIVAPEPALSVPEVPPVEAPQFEAEVAPQVAPQAAPQFEPVVAQQVTPEIVPQAPPPVAAQPPQEHGIFDVAALPTDQQELHRRANRVAKVSMQDIKMLRPGDVRTGKENNDLCLRLRDDIERAHKEYERRFHVILDHPVDYFYSWMVEILGEGDPRSLGEYPYPSPVARR